MCWRILKHLTVGVVLQGLVVLVVHADDLMSPGMTAAQVKARLGTPQVPIMVDLRTPPEFAIVHLPEAINIPLKELAKRINEARPGKDRELLIYCLNGSRTRQAEPILYAHGIDNFYHLDGSLEGWLKDKYPIEKGGVTKKTW